MPVDGDLRYIDVSASIRIRAILKTSDAVVSPSGLWMKLSYVSTEPAITLEPDWTVAGAEAGEVIRLNVHFNNTAASSSSIVWLNVYLDENLEYESNNTDTLAIFDSFITDDNPNIQKYVFTSIPNSNNQFWIDARMGSGISDGTLLQTTVTLDYLDPMGNKAESLLEPASVRADSPLITAELVANEASADIDEIIHYQVHVNNTGRGTAESIWVNSTLDNRLQIPLQDSQNISQQVSNLEWNSSQILHFNATLRENVPQDSIIPVTMELQYSDPTGFIRQTDSNTLTSRATLESQITLVITSQVSHINSDDMLIFTVYYNNTGYGSAETIDFNMTIPEGLKLEISSQACSVLNDVCIWELEDVSPGSHSFTITFRAEKMSQEFHAADVHIFMQVTDPVEGLQEQVSSNILSIQIQRIYTFWEEIYWPWSGIAMALAGFFIIYGLWHYFKPESPTIDDIFVIYRDGRLISHRKSSSGLKAELDGDLVSAMLTVVQEFISESLSKDKTDKVKKMEFGDRELYVERGDNIHISVMYSGSMNKKLETQIIELRQKIENEHPFLPTWDGRMTKLEDINPQLDKLIEEWQSLNGSDSGDYSPDTDA